MIDSDRTIAAALATGFFAVIVAVTCAAVPFNTPLPLAIILPAIGLVWIALHNIGARS